MQHRALWEDGVLFHIANEGIRLGGQGGRIKREGIVKGVADLCLAIPRMVMGHSTLNETPRCYQQPSRKTWQKNIERHGNKYVVCKSL